MDYRNRLSRVARFNRIMVMGVMVCPLLAVANMVASDRQNPKTGPTDAPGGTVVARVDSEPIYKTEVRRLADTVLRDSELDEEERKRRDAMALEHLIDRWLVVSYLQHKQMAVSEQKIDLEIEKHRRRLNRQNMTLEDHLQGRELSITGYRRELFWKLSWQNYIGRQVTDERLEKFFQKYRRNYDGTEIEVAHILFRSDVTGENETIEQAKQRAAKLADRIRAGQLTFDEAAQTFSDAPSGKAGGRIGKIRRHEPMSERFSATAFALGEGEVSSPTVSRYGIHLIKCLAVHPGTKTSSDVRMELISDASTYIFRRLADRARQQVKITYTGTMPYYLHGSEELVETR